MIMSYNSFVYLWLYTLFKVHLIHVKICEQIYFTNKRLFIIETVIIN